VKPRYSENGFTPLRRSAEIGFTLVEMMVALAIFGMVAASGVALLSFSVRAQASAQRQLDTVARDRRMTALLTGDLAQAVPRPARDSDGNPLRAFEGVDGETPGIVMGYVRSGRSNPQARARSGLERVDLVFENGRLERRGYAMVDGAAPDSVMMLADGLESVRARYRDKDGWRDRWDVAKRDAMPRAVELTLKPSGKPALLTSYLVGSSIR